MKAYLLAAIILFIVSCAGGAKQPNPCGNGLQDDGEECDDSNLNDGDGCSSLCLIEHDWVCTDWPSICEQSCGNGELDAGEDCDDGGESSSCNSDCTISICGDGKHNQTAGEQCDDGTATAQCNSDCTLPGCGDGIKAPHEECDDGGETETCNSNCTLSECGDGVTNDTAGEECDDGGESSVCNANCTLSECGDGVTNVTAGEECDGPGETVDCDPDCSFSECGDGYRNATDGEECDDGDLIDTNGCSNSCISNVVCEDPLLTTLAGGNGWAGNMFDIVALRNITITGFEGSFHTVTQGVEIWYRYGTYVGSENTQANWTLLGTATITGQGAGTATPIPINFSVPVSSGQRVAFYVTSQNNTYGGANIYSNGTGGTIYASNSDLQYYTGIGNQYPFGGIFEDRIFNGRILYDCN
ncbi:hypothetical protein KKF34_10490 [Myxococcota bacterium]|nr:hypothetical protein [Myxococcota bacterium]MBU1380523.1 hypothetical protein [Myxococcota bacterium]MBU1497294.1 hypothetical protein [Myxococcota bacterium]